MNATAIEEQAVGFWDITDAAYHADSKHVSNSMLKVFSESVPRYYQTFITREIEREESDALRLGRAFHLMVLEPRKALDEIVRAPKVNKRTNAGKEEWEAFLDAAEGHLIVSTEEYDQLTAMRDSLLANPTTRKILELDGMHEMPFRWRDESSGLWCKAKVDLISADYIVDLKTIDSLSNWQKNVANFGYHRQQAFYQSGDEHVTRHFDRRDLTKTFIFVVVEKQAPYESAAFTLSSETAALGRSLNLDAMIELADRMRRNDWKSRYYRTVTETSLPRWALKGA